VVLPPAQSDASRPDDAPAPAVKARRGRVLVVDDEPMIGRALQRLLGGEHDVVALTRADAAIGKIDDGERFDVILCDLMMPDVTGMDFHGWLKERAPREANDVIFLTGGVFTERAATFVSEVSNLRLEKPIDARKLRSVVNERIASRPEG
jgi:CheY-like chemotaxis protein